MDHASGGTEVLEYTTIDEDALRGRCQAAGEAVTVRSGLPDKAKFPVL